MYNYVTITKSLNLRTFGAKQPVNEIPRWDHPITFS